MLNNRLRVLMLAGLTTFAANAGAPFHDPPNGTFTPSGDNRVFINDQNGVTTAKIYAPQGYQVCHGINKDAHGNPQGAVMGYILNDLNYTQYAHFFTGKNCDGYDQYNASGEGSYATGAGGQRGVVIVYSYYLD